MMRHPSQLIVFALDVKKRKYLHVCLAKGASFIYPYTTAFGLLVSVFLVMLPAISNSWEALVVQNAVTEIVFKEFSFFGGFSLVVFCLLLLFTMIASALSASLSVAWDMKKELALPTARQVTEREIYPETITGEICFYSMMGIYALSFFVWIYFPLGWVVFLLRSGT